MQRDRFIKFSTRVKAPVATVFEALTDSAMLASWFPSKADTDPRPGGKYTYTFVFKNNPDSPAELRGVFNEVVPNEKVSYTWPIRRGDSVDTTTVEFTLTDLGAETEVSLSHSGFGAERDSDRAYERHTEGWTAFMTNIKTVLERGEDQRARLLGMLV